MSKSKPAVYYVFGNHMHWVDMEWLWGYDVLPDSVEDMLRYCRATGTKANINFDGIGYEKLAAEAPKQLDVLRRAIRSGTVEVVGGSYGQPYGLFHGGESNVRQRVFGVRTIKRLLGVRPRTFWEEEFDFFPQLPQLLKGVDYHYASLFFQWTWHTPVIPEETRPSVHWQGLDGSTLLTATINRFNLHQWPEDFEDLLASGITDEMSKAGIVQWLELMPSPDWMCRGELMIPPMRRLLSDERMDIIPATLSEFLETTRDGAPKRTYSLDEVYHGVSLGKNGDLFRRLSRRGEEALLTAEAISTVSGGFGRPYPGWNVYPVWELEEAWRELLSAQHHDNDECEGICGHIGQLSYERSYAIANHVVNRSLKSLAERVSAPSSSSVIWNPLGWERGGVAEIAGRTLRVPPVPPFGYRTLFPEELESYAVTGTTRVAESENTICLSRGDLEVVISRITGSVEQIRSAEFPGGVFPQRNDTVSDAAEGTPENTPGPVQLAGLFAVYEGEPDQFDIIDIRVDSSEAEPVVIVRRQARNGSLVVVRIRLAPDVVAVDIGYSADDISPPDGDMASALATFLPFPISGSRIVHDHPFGVTTINPAGRYTRKYPTGDWMTSAQRYEEVVKPFTALSMVDVGDEDRGLLYLHDGSQAFAGRDEGVVNVLSMNDPWDEEYFVGSLRCNVRVIPRKKMSNSTRWKRAQEFTRPLLARIKRSSTGDLPAKGTPVTCDNDSVALTAFYRESRDFVRELHDYPQEAGEYPILLRLVELDGASEEVALRLPGNVRYCYRTNLLGEPQESLAVASDGTTVTFAMRPYEVATLVFESREYEKTARDLDSYREVWARSHKEGAENGGE